MTSARALKKRDHLIGAGLCVAYVLLLAGTALGTIVPAASLYAASYRTSLGAARLEIAMESGGD